MNELAITDEKLDLIKRTVAKGASNEELELFLYTCKRTGLDPLTKQIYCIKRGGQMTIQTGIDGYRAIADRTGKYAGNDDPVFDSETKPRKATVTVYKLVESVRCPFTSTARWDQYYPGHGKSPLWDKMPHLMLGKCAEALALRKAFPQDLSGLYTKEEMDQADPDFPVKPGRQYALKPEPEVKDLPASKNSPIVSHVQGTSASELSRKPEAPVQDLPKDKWVEKLKNPSPSKAEAEISEAAAKEVVEQETKVLPGVIKRVQAQPDAKGSLYWIEMDFGGEYGTRDKALAEDAKIMIGEKVNVLVQENVRKPGTWIYLGFEPIEQLAAEELPWP